MGADRGAGRTTSRAAVPPPAHEPTSLIAEPPAPRPRRQRRRGKGIAVALVLALVAAALGTGAWWVGWGRYTTTPGVIGLEQAAAEAKLTEAGLVPAVDEVYSESVAKGIVITTDPRPGSRILPDGEVTVKVSLGKERYDVPDVTGKSVDEAEAALAAVKFVPGQPVEEWSETVEAGRVIGTRPAFGTPESLALPVGTAVTLVVSKGRKPLKVRSFVGKDADRATEALEGKGLKVKVVEEKYSDDVDEGDVISQAPDSGTLFKGDTVELVVSKGPELVAVPSVRYLSTDAAVEKLEELGFVVKKERATIYLTGSVAWDTDPRSGTKVKKGSTIVLYVV
ncbi:PASTA domain-containing protein [Nocardioides sp. R1-1]|uniref:Stk1 family PASTA domain-containing Ser/Thr kinase n=1 Tax=Nocardioides sp. R1-1 TaxID=3383502 RepID=UPI0038CF90FA